MIPPKAIKKIKNETHLEMAAGFLLFYQIFPQTNEGIEQAKKTAASKDTWLAPSDLPEYYDGIDSDIMVGKENDAIRAIRNHFKEFYGLTPSKQKDNKPNIPAIKEKIKTKLKRTGKKISLKRRANRYIISQKRPRQDLLEAANDIISELLDEKAYETEILEEELSQGTFRVKLPVNIKLPPTMGYIQGNKARWEPEFESDLDAAIYFAGKSPLPKGNKQAAVLNWLQNTLGIPWTEISKHRDKILEKILSTVNLPGVEEEYPYVYIDIVDERFESKYATPEEDEEEFLEDQISDEFDDEEDDEEEINEEKTESDLDSRMNEAFDRRLDDLLDSVKNPDTQKTPKPKKPKKPRTPKQKTSKIQKKKAPKTLGYNLPRTRAQNFNAYLGNKISDAFKLAAIARRNAKLSGAPSQGKGFFLKKALLNEFGGDFLRRTKGTFSTDPSKSEDPASSRGQRFAATLSNYLKPAGEVTKPSSSTAPVQLSLFDKPEAVKINDKKLKTVIENKTSNLNKIFDGLNKKLSSLLSKKSDAIQTSSDKKDKLMDLVQKFEEVKEAIINSNTVKKTLVKVKKKKLDVTKDNINDANAALRESKLEEGTDLSSTSDYSFGEDDEKKTLMQRVIDVIVGDDDDDDGGGSDGFNPDIDIDLDRRNRRPGAKRRLLRRRFNRIGGGIRGGLTKASDTISDKGGKAGRFLVNKGRGIGSFLGKQSTKILDAGKSGLVKTGKFIAENPKLLKLGTAFGKFGAKFLPGLGIAAGGADAAYRKSTGDNVGAGIAGFGAAADALAAGSAATGIGLPVAGIATLASWASDITLLGKDIFDIFTNNDSPKKLSEGAVVNKGTKVMVGEAGPEAIVPLSSSGASGLISTMGMINPSLGSVGTLLGVTKKVLSNVGPAAGPIRPIIENIIAPLEKLYGAPSFTFNTDVGEGLGTVATAKSKLGGGSFNLIEMFKKILNIDSSEDGFGNIMEELAKLVGGGGGAEAPGVQGKAIPVSAGAKGVLDLIASVESGGSYDVFNTSRGGTPGKATEKTIQWLADNAQGAIGKYQHMPEFILARARAAGFSPNTLFTPDVQDAITVKMLETSHGLKDFLAGKMSAETFAAKLAPTWRGLPQGPAAAARLGGTADSTYNDRYASGNAAHMKWADAVATLRTIKPSPTPAAGGQQKTPAVSSIFSFAPQQTQQPIISSEITRQQGSAIAILNNMSSVGGTPPIQQQPIGNVASQSILPQKNSAYSDVMSMRLAIT